MLVCMMMVAFYEIELASNERSSNHAGLRPTDLSLCSYIFGKKGKRFEESSPLRETPLFVY
eukprot:scaffold1590_cov140-Cylindrotheca_fusiformis.AAC.3